ncbi:elongation factor P maturation arginine rhamnosyltransferase EarP [Pseudoduganella eburnea]|uniref:Protein-arginine rhamnosyltransferase n=1 Tax=Massilia eburnea TaxID=1776165 RepID=A0A6L6QFR0_9BURK|nr:elongation factor P maturation arginine rhamnosyltransferase EarP [Massilia eburnea]MTW11212.1 elongation factor P maturation arginine rhamnosyltransferase EarP [Massilia eburnea]
MPSLSLDLFCKVVDNFGDIGICWRLARQLQREHGIAVTLWVDDMVTFQRICAQVDLRAERQLIDSVAVRHWASQEGEFTPAEVADIVIEFFGCDIPPGYIAAMAQRPQRPVWLNLEGLSAEEWVEGCHSLPSKHPRLPLTKYFFFPGFTEKTGGLLCETGLEAERKAYISDPAAVSGFLSSLGVTAAEAAAMKVSLFCYPYAPVAELFAAWREAEQALTCLVPEGVANDAVAAFLGAPAVPGAVRTAGALTVRVLPFVPQQDYDKLLWSCDLNFVRGEDSWVRAQWAGKPFIWHIYAQDENLHHKKLRAFLQRYSAGSALDEFSLCWNGAAPGNWPSLWKALVTAMPEISAKSAEWQQKILANGDLATNLTKFCASLR